jgi:hypothetical protein
LHPYLGLSWFRKVDATGSRAERAKILFEHAFARYKAAEPVSEPATRRTAPASSFSSFIDDVSMADTTVEDSAPTPPIRELDCYLQADSLFGRGEPNGPLLWWKVRTYLSLNVLHTDPYLSRLMNVTFLLSQKWPGTSLLSQAQVFPWSSSFRSLDTFAPRSAWHP